eukprot:gene19250-25102_t
MDDPYDPKKDAFDDNDFDKFSKASTEDLENELQNHNALFEKLERDFQEVLTEMMGDQSLEKFRLEYEKLHRALKRSHEQEKRLVKKCRDLNSEILNNQAKIKTALRLSQEDQKTIAHLQKEMEKTWKLVYMSQEKEARAKDTIGQLKEEMSNLSKLVERGAGLSLNQENQMKELKQAKEELQRQVDEQVSAIAVLQTQLAEQYKQSEELRSEREETSKTNNDLRDRLVIKETEYIRETKRREKTQKELHDARSKQDELTKKIDQLTNELSANKSAFNDLDKKNQDAKAAFDRNFKDFEELSLKNKKLEVDRERISGEVTEQRSNYMASQDEVRLRDVQISELKKRISEWETKLKQQQQLYEAVRTDRNQTSKNYLESQDEIAELRKKFKILEHQIEQLKEEIASKDQAIVKQHFEYQRIEKHKESFENKANRLVRLTESNEQIIKQLESELKRLLSMIKRMDEEALNQRKEYDSVINERDLLGTQLIRRNDELALLYEKLRIQSSTLKAGELQYAARLDDIRMLRIKLKEVTRDFNTLKNSGFETDNYKREILHLQKELLSEKTKVTALSEELENPMNVHRWRKLEGSDPATFELIQKIQTLQRRLISKTEEVVEKSLTITEKEKQINELKNIISRQPGIEIAEQINTYQTNLKNKTQIIKSMASELNMFHAMNNEYKYEIEKLNRDNTELKRKYYIKKRKEQLDNDNSNTQLDNNNNVILSKTAPQLLQNEQIVNAKNARSRFIGGGYAIK